MRPILRSLFITVLLTAGAAADVYGQSAGAFSRLGFGARAHAMSNAGVADATGAGSAFFNPALAPFESSQNFEASVALMTQDRELQYLQFATPLRPRAGITAGLIRAGVSEIDGRDASGYHTEQFSIEEFAFFFAFGLRVSERLSAGVGFRLYRSDYVEQVAPATSVGFNAGLNYRPSERISLGIAVDDLLAEYTWDTSDLYGASGRTTADRFPTRIRAGGTYALLEGRVLIAVDYESMIAVREVRHRDVRLVGNAPQQTTRSELLSIHSARARAGGEYWLAEPFAVRAGFDRIGAQTGMGMTPTAGFALRHEIGQLQGRIDYAFMLEPYALGTMHVFTLAIEL